MKGVVEIYKLTSEGTKELVYKKNNMTVIGFSEQITDLLTTPSSIKFPTDSSSQLSNNHALDASNYEIQAFSMSKDIQQFKKNQHAYSTTNLILNSVLSSTEYWDDSNEVIVTPGATIGPVSGTSGMLVEATTSAGYFTQIINIDGSAGYAGHASAFDEPYFSGANFTFSVDMKMNRDSPPVGMSGGPDYSGYSVIIPGVGQAAGGFYATVVKWNEYGEASLAPNRFHDYTQPGTGVGGIKKLSNDWYRVYTTVLQGGGKVDPSAMTPRIYPSYRGFLPTSYGSSAVDSSAGSIYISRPQLELGKVPTEYVNTASESVGRDNTLAYSLLNDTKPYGHNGTVYKYVYNVMSGTGGRSLSSVYGDAPLDKGASAYLPETSGLRPPVSYQDRELTPFARTPVEEALGINFIKGQIPAAISLSSNLYLSSFDTGWTHYDDSNTGLGRHVAYLGAYVDRTDLPIATQYITSLSSLAMSGYSSPLVSQLLYNGIVGTPSSIDRYGFWALSGNGASSFLLPEVAASDSLFVKSVDSDFSSTGNISYIAKIGNVAAGIQKDSPLLNIFGGVDIIGLWGIDQKAIRDINILDNPPYSAIYDTSNIAKEPTRRYKLFSKIILNDNVVKCEGKDKSIFGGADKIGLVGNYAPLEIHWRISFL